MRPVMSRSLLLMFVATLVVGCGKEPAEDEGTKIPTDDCRAVVKEFATRLQAELKTSLGEGGPASAISVCKEKAPSIASALSEEYGWEIGRTSLKLRNPSNAPDTWEELQLREFDKEAAAGADLAGLESVAVDGKVIRYMKAIPVQGACLLCHGETLHPDVKGALTAAYPNDKARGYKLGQIRGAFSVTIPPTE